MMEFRRSITSGSSSARSGSYERNTDQEKQPSFKKSTQSASPGSEKCPESNIVQTVVKSTDSQQIIKEKICTVIPKGQPFSYEDVSPGVSVIRIHKEILLLKKSGFKLSTDNNPLEKKLLD